jgi:hypothetical protein
MTNPRTQVLLSLLPPGAVFRHTYAEDALWRPDSSGYVNERDPLRAGLYEPDGYYAPWAAPDERPNDHSFTVDAAETLREYVVQDGTTLALLIDEVIRLRTQLAAPSLRAWSPAPAANEPPGVHDYERAMEAALRRRFAEVLDTPCKPVPYTDAGIPVFHNALVKVEAELTDEQRAAVAARVDAMTDEDWQAFTVAALRPVRLEDLDEPSA